MQSKLCTKCSTTKPISDFRFANKAKGTYQTWCRECFSSYEKAKWHSKDDSYKQKRYETRRKHYNIKRQFVLEYKQNSSCFDCGISDYRVLDFDHIDRDSKNGNISDMIHAWSLDTIKKEISKCRILCANCHRIRTHEQLGYYCF